MSDSLVFEYLRPAELFINIKQQFIREDFDYRIKILAELSLEIIKISNDIEAVP